MWIELNSRLSGRVFIREDRIVVIRWEDMNSAFLVYITGGHSFWYDPDHDTIHKHDDFDLSSLDLYVPDDEGHSER